ncbi:kinesin-like protein KIF28P, partial [Clarias magur]
FQMFNCTEPLYTPVAWRCVNPQLDYCAQFTALKTSHTLLTYLQSNAVVLQLWGLQEGCPDMTTHLDSVKKTPENSILIDTAEDSEDTSTDGSVSDQSVCLQVLHEDLEQLKITNAALKKENDTLREQLNTHTQCGVECARWHKGRLRSSCDAEFARALKVFYHSMTSVRAQLQRLRRHRPS